MPKNKTKNLSYYPLRNFLDEELKLSLIKRWCPTCNEQRWVSKEGLMYRCHSCKVEWLESLDKEIIKGGKQIKIEKMNHITG